MKVNLKRKILVVGYGQDGKILHEQCIRNKEKIHIIVKDKTIKIEKEAFVKILDIENKKTVFKYLKKFKNLDIYFLATSNISSTQKERDDIFKKNFDSNILGLKNFLDYMSFNRNFKLFYASSSHIFENSNLNIQDENTKKSYNSNYAFVKYLGLEICEFYRKEKKVFCSVGILYTHVSKYINDNFLIKQLAIKIKNKNKNKNTVYVKNANSKLDIMLAEDAVNAMQKILKLDISHTFIISSGKLVSIKKIFFYILKYYNLNHKINLKSRLTFSKRSSYLFGNNKKLLKKIKWKPNNNLKEIINEVLD